jgi:hypothetical protein
MWILKWLPFWIFYAMFFVGIIGFLATYLIRFIPIPAIYMYKTPIQICSVILITIGVYMSGAISNEEAWLARVAELEVKVAQAEVKSAQENTKIVEKIIYKDRFVKEKGDTIIKYVDKEIVKYDNQCKIPQEFIKALNDATGVAK